jgi:hypothetical protein
MSSTIPMANHGFISGLLNSMIGLDMGTNSMLTYGGGDATSHRMPARIYIMVPLPGIMD